MSPPTAKKYTGVARGIGKTKGGLNSKLHLVCDGQGRPPHLSLTAGYWADIAQARQCLEGQVRRGTRLIADRVDDANHLRS